MDGWGGDGTENWSIVKPPTNHYFILFFDAFLREAIKNLFINSMCFFLGGGTVSNIFQPYLRYLLLKIWEIYYKCPKSVNFWAIKMLSGSMQYAVSELYDKASRAWFAISDVLYKYKQWTIACFTCFSVVWQPIASFYCEFWLPSSVVK